MLRVSLAAGVSVLAAGVAVLAASTLQHVAGAGTCNMLQVQVRCNMLQVQVRATCCRYRYVQHGAGTMQHLAGAGTLPVRHMSVFLLSQDSSVFTHGHWT